MLSKSSISIIALAFISGFVGSTVSTRVFQAEPAVAQQGPVIQNVVAAKEFRVVDANGQVHAKLFLQYPNELSRKLFNSSYPTPELEFFDRSGNSKISISVSEKGTPSITLYDDGGDTRASLSLNEDNEPSFYLYGSGKLRGNSLSLDVSKDGTARLSIAKGVEPRILLSLNEDESQDLCFFKSGFVSDKNYPFVHLGVFDKKSPFLQISDLAGASAILGSISLKSEITHVVEQRPASSLVLFNQNGKVISTLP